MIDTDGESDVGATSRAGSERTEAPSAAGASRSARRFLVGVGALGVVLALLVAATVVAAVRWQEAHGRVERGDAAVATARDVVTRLSSLGQRDLQPQVDALLAQSTGPFRAQLANATTLLARVAENAQFDSRGAVTHAALEGNDGQLATVLVMAQSEITNVAAREPSVRRYQLSVALQWDGDRWLAQTVDQVA